MEEMRHSIGPSGKLLRLGNAKNKKQYLYDVPDLVVKPKLSVISFC